MTPRFLSLFLLLAGLNLCAADAPDYSSFIRTPPAPATPRINGPTVFGVSPGSPLLYTIPATGDRPMEFSAGVRARVVHERDRPRKRPNLCPSYKIAPDLVGESYKDSGRTGSAEIDG